MSAVSRFVRGATTFEAMCSYGSGTCKKTTVADTFRGLEIKIEVSISMLRFFDLAVLSKNDRFDLTSITSLELYDCRDPRSLLAAVAHDSRHLTRFVLVYSSISRTNSKVQTYPNKTLLNILRNNSGLEELSIYVTHIESPTAEELIAILPVTMRRLFIIRPKPISSDPKSTLRSCQAVQISRALV